MDAGTSDRGIRLRSALQAIGGWAFPLGLAMGLALGGGLAWMYLKAYQLPQSAALTIDPAQIARRVQWIDKQMQSPGGPSSAELVEARNRIEAARARGDLREAARLLDEVEAQILGPLPEQ